MWRLPRTSDYSYPRVTAIQIDVHPTGEILINMTYTLPTPVHVCLAYASCGYSSYVATFHESSTELSRATSLERKGSRHNPQHVGWPICESVPSFSPEPTLKQWGQSQASIDVRLLCLLDPYHQHVIGTLNTCSLRPTHRSLTDTGGSYSLGGAGLPHTTLRPSQPAVSTFHLRAPPGL
jgi:hypothetical protein